jgi:hypothetical protein
MNLLTYLCALFASFSGLFFGIILSNIAVEEVSSISKYLKYLNILFVGAIIFVATYKTNFIYASMAVFVIMLLMSIFRNRYDGRWIYASLGAVFYVAMLSDELLNVSAMIFVYGLSITTLDANKLFKNKINNKIKSLENIVLIKNTLSNYVYFVLVGIACYIIFRNI